MTQFYYHQILQQWLLKCHSCKTWNQIVYENPTGDVCLRCLWRDEKRAA